MKSSLVETTVEALGRVPAGSSCIVEREGPRLIVKIWRRGRLEETRRLRATGLPVGFYEVVGSTVIHRHDPSTILAELQRHQDRLRMASPEFLAVAKQIAKQLGGKLDRWDDDYGALLGYQVTPRTGIDDKKLDRARRDVAPESAILFRTGSQTSSPIGISIAARDLDLIPRICTRWYDTVDQLVRRLDAECGAHLEILAHDLIVLQLDRKPKQPKPLVRLVDKLARESEVEVGSSAEVERMLADRRLGLWWD